MDRPVHVVTDPGDPRAAPFRDLRARARAGPADEVVVEGALAIERLLDSPLAVAAVLGTPARLAALAPWLARRPEVVRLAADAAVLDAIAGLDLHRGCLALARRPAPAPADDPRLDAPPAGPRSVVVVVEGVADPANLGAIVRCAAAFSAGAVVVDGAGADPFSPRAVRSAMGHGFRLPVLVARDLPAAVARLRAAGRRVLAAALTPAATPLPALVAPDHAVLLLGTEGAGLSPRLLALADEAVRVPMAPGVDSLNVAAAAAVLLYALTVTAAPAADARRGRDGLA